MLRIIIVFTFFFFFFFFFRATAELQQSVIPIHSNKTARSCSYTVVVKTSCSSVTYTTDKISLAFGDAYGNWVYEPRIDDPSTRKFESCSTYVFDVRGPYLDIICYLDMLRNGSDGWKPKQVKVKGPDFKPIIFYFDTFLPDGVWYGVNSCMDLSIVPSHKFYAIR